MGCEDHFLLCRIGHPWRPRLRCARPLVAPPAELLEVRIRVLLPVPRGHLLRYLVRLPRIVHVYPRVLEVSRLVDYVAVGRYRECPVVLVVHHHYSAKRLAEGQVVLLFDWKHYSHGRVELVSCHCVCCILSLFIPPHSEALFGECRYSPGNQSSEGLPELRVVEKRDVFPVVVEQVLGQHGGHFRLVLYNQCRQLSPRSLSGTVYGTECLLY